MAITSLLGGAQSRSQFYQFFKEMLIQTQYQSDSTISTNTTATGTILAKNLTINSSITLTVYDKLGVIICDTLTLNGTITATGIGGAGGQNAGNGSSYGFGGNGGGSIIILTNRILGTGTISANGTNGTRVGDIAAYINGTAPVPGRFKKLVGTATAPASSNSPGLGQVKIAQNDGLNGFINGSFIANLEPGDCIFSGGGTGSSGGNSSTITGDGGGGGASLFFDGGTGGDVLVSATNGGLGGGGGGGGGFIFIASMSSVPALTISANGGNGASTTLLTNNNSGGGGGGAGGVVSILAPSNSATMSATAGTGGTGNFGSTSAYTGANGTAGLTMFRAMNLS